MHTHHRRCYPCIVFYVWKKEVKIIEERGHSFSTYAKCPKELHCVKSVQIRSYFWSVFSCIRTEYRDLLREKCPNNRDLFRTLSKLFDGTFCRNGEWLKVIILAKSSIVDWGYYFNFIYSREKRLNTSTLFINCIAKTWAELMEDLQLKEKSPR